MADKNIADQVGPLMGVIQAFTSIAALIGVFAVYRATFSDQLMQNSIKLLDAVILKVKGSDQDISHLAPLAKFDALLGWLGASHDPTRHRIKEFGPNVDDFFTELEDKNKV